MEPEYLATISILELELQHDFEHLTRSELGQVSLELIGALKNNERTVSFSPFPSISRIRDDNLISDIQWPYAAPFINSTVNSVYRGIPRSTRPTITRLMSLTSLKLRIYQFGSDIVAQLDTGTCTGEYLRGIMHRQRASGHAGHDDRKHGILFDPCSLDHLTSTVKCHSCGDQS